MSRPSSITSAVTLNPSAFVSGSYAGITGQTNPVGNGSSNTTYATVNLTTGNSAVTEVIWSFDCTSIPVEATITSVACSCKGSISTTNTSRIITRQVQLYSGTSAKGSASTLANSTTAFNITCGTWTREELQNARIRFYGVRGNSNTGTTYYFRFYGADLTVNYSINGTAYEITATSTYTGATVTPASQDIFSGQTGVVRIDVDDVSSIIVKDNNVDVTDQLVAKPVVTSGSSETVLGAYTLLSGSFNGQGATYFQGLVGKGVGSTQTTSNYYSSSNGTIAGFTYNLIFSDIPSNATITRLYCQVNGHAESTSQSSEYMCVQLILGTTATTLSKELNFKSIGTSNSTQTIEATTLPTVAQLPNLKLYCRLGYYGGAINGATCYVEYTLPDSGNPYYYEYTINNINADHTIFVSESIYIPPEEDPDKTYYSVTISSINATTNPVRGTTRVESGTSETITITPSDPQLSLALDNGVDISSQLVAHGGGQITSALTATAQGASYGFTASSANTGYYMSTNFRQANSASVCRVTFTLPVRCLVTVNYINYAEATYDYGIFGNIDTALGTTYTADSNAYKVCSSSSDNSPSVQTLTYEIESGTHYIDIKYRKDTYTDSNYDSLQFQIASIEPLEPLISYYTYDLNNINQNHSLVFIFGNVSYYFINSSTSSDAKLYPDGQMVALQGDLYKLTIVPNNTGDTIALRDNNVDVTNNLEKKQETIEKEGQLITVVNYIYTLSNVQTGHTLVVYTQASEGEWYLKDNGTWDVVTVYKKINGVWVEQDKNISVFNSGSIYVHK